MTRTLTLDEARRIVVRAQLLDADRPGDVVEVAEQLGYIKIDPTATFEPEETDMVRAEILSLGEWLGVEVEGLP